MWIYASVSLRAHIHVIHAYHYNSPTTSMSREVMSFARDGVCSLPESNHHTSGLIRKVKESIPRVRINSLNFR